jgi:NADH dehydrogenase (ubiquinone) Fe-S protein 3
MNSSFLTTFKTLASIIPSLTFSQKQDEFILVVLPQNLLISLTILKLHVGYQYKLLTCISAVDLLNKVYRFSVVYELLSLRFNTRIRLKIFIAETTFVQSSTILFINARWWEREAWDLYGIYFKGHTNLRRILTDYGFEGFPLRKDFPLSGYIELRYNESKKRIVTEPIQLAQEFRTFQFESPW